MSYPKNCESNFCSFSTAFVYLSFNLSATTIFFLSKLNFLIFKFIWVKCPVVDFCFTANKITKKFIMPFSKIYLEIFWDFSTAFAYLKSKLSATSLWKLQKEQFKKKIIAFAQSSVLNTFFPGLLMVHRTENQPQNPFL